MKDQEARVLGRILAVEELDAVSGARTLPSTDMTVLPRVLGGGETGTIEDSGVAADSGTTADSGTLADSGTTADSGTVSDSGTASDTTPSQDTKPVFDTLQQP